jgi:uncharacterized protein YbjT (DUF2867 family)
MPSDVAHLQRQYRAALDEFGRDARGAEPLQASGYFRAKLTQENHIKSSPIP